MANSYFTRARAYLRRFLPVSSKQRFLIGLIGKAVYVESFPFLGDSDSGVRDGEPGIYTVAGVGFHDDGYAEIALWETDRVVGGDYHCYYNFDDPEFRFKVI